MGWLLRVVPLSVDAHLAPMPCSPSFTPPPISDRSGGARDPAYSSCRQPRSRCSRRGQASEAESTTTRVSARLGS
jgi:hypothetical protein